MKSKLKIKLSGGMSSPNECEIDGCRGPFNVVVRFHGKDLMACEDCYAKIETEKAKNPRHIK